MNKHKQKIFEDLLGGLGATILLIVAILKYDEILEFRTGTDMSAKGATALFRWLDSIGGKFFVILILLLAAIYAFSRVVRILRKQKKLHDSINTGTLLKEHSVINFDNKLLEVLDLSWEGKKYRGYGRIYSKGEEENWKPVEFSSLTLTNDGTSKLSGQFKYLTDNEWEAKGEDVDELPWNKRKQKEAELETWNSDEGKCPACGAIINNDNSSCPECGLSFNNDASS